MSTETKDLQKNPEKPAEIQKAAPPLRFVPEVEGEMSSDMFRFPVAVLVQGNAMERERPWFKPEYQAGNVVIPDVGVIAAAGKEPLPFIAIKMIRYWNVYSPRVAGSDRVAPIRVDKEADLKNWSPTKLEALGWTEGAEFDQKAGTYIKAQLADLGAFVDASDDSEEDTPPLATEMRDFLCVTADGTLFFYRLSSRRDTLGQLKLASTSYISSGEVPTAFCASVQPRKSPRGEPFFGLTLGKIPGPPNEAHMRCAINWQMRLKGKEIRVVEEGAEPATPF